MSDRVIGRRLAFYVAGYDPPAPAAVHRRFSRELRRFESTWGVAAHVSEPRIGEDQAAWSLATSGTNWRVDTDFRLVRWDDVIAENARRSPWSRFPRGALALLDFAVSGALWGYLRSNWRYALFFLYPIVLLALLTGVAALGGLLANRLAGSVLAALAVLACVLAALLLWAGRALQLNHLLDDWIFARDYLRAGHPVLGPRLDRLAREIVSLSEAGEADEILVVGHSLGAVLAIDLIDRALAHAGASGPVPRIAFVAVGSSALKIGLHRGARRFRSAVARVAAAPSVFWAEYQSLSDVMSFYKADPVAAMGIASPRHPVVRAVRVSRMLDPAVYRRIRHQFFRLHCQFVSGNDRRAPYDYFMMLCGPLSAEQQVRSRDGAVSAFAQDGSLIAPGASRPSHAGVGSG